MPERVGSGRTDVRAPDRADVVVVGGGPAGCAVARSLALCGRDVVILAGPPTRRPSHGESLPPSCRKPLAALGLVEAVATAGFLPTRGNTAAWAGRALAAQPFGAGAVGFQVLRERLDAVLLKAARAAGAHVILGAAARRVELPASERDEGWGMVQWQGAHRGGRIRARWILDCSGRAGVVARCASSDRDYGPATVALLGLWRRREEWPLEDESHTIVESYHDGWAWSVPVQSGLRYVAAMVDPRNTALSRWAGFEGMYSAELAKTARLRGLLADATLERRPWACAATAYRSRKHSGPGFLLVGDAGSFLDPLSSQGVKKALVSAWLAAVVVHTCLSRPSMLEAALALFEERERTAYARHDALTGRYYTEAAAWHGHPFWAARTEFASNAPAVSNADSDPEAVRDHPGFGAALKRVRRASSLHFRPAAGLRRVARPTVREQEIVLEEHLATAAAPGGIRFLWGVELPKLVEVAQEHDQVPVLYEAYGRVRPLARFPDFLGALSALLTLGMLEIVGDP